MSRQRTENVKNILRALVDDGDLKLLHTFRGRRETPWFGAGLHDSYVLEMVRPSETKGREIVR